MNLKAVHLVFVTALSALTFGTAVWKFRDYSSIDGAIGDLWFAIGSLVAGVLVLFYGWYFLKKMKQVGYL
jgi:hypothetical protein